MRLAVAGGTGTVGSLVVSRARERGHAVVILARSAGVDVATSRGLDIALRGSDAVVDVLGIDSIRGGASRRFFTTTTANLLDSGARAGVAHYLALSIVGIDGFRGGYYGAKLAQEQRLVASPRASTVLRAAQFHEFAPLLLRRARVGPVLAVPRMLAAPVAALEVADRLVDLVEAGPQGPGVRAEDIVGPERMRTVDMVRRYLDRTGSSLRALDLPVPTPYWRQAASGVLAGDSAALRGRITFEEWLDRVT